jgi:hypothetical protein
MREGGLHEGELAGTVAVLHVDLRDGFAAREEAVLAVDVIVVVGPGIGVVDLLHLHRSVEDADEGEVALLLHEREVAGTAGRIHADPAVAIQVKADDCRARSWGAGNT